MRENDEEKLIGNSSPTDEHNSEEDELAAIESVDQNNEEDRLAANHSKAEYHGNNENLKTNSTPADEHSNEENEFATTSSEDDNQNKKISKTKVI